MLQTILSAVQCLVRSLVSLLTLLGEKIKLEVRNRITINWWGLSRGQRSWDQSGFYWLPPHGSPGVTLQANIDPENLTKYWHSWDPAPLAQRLSLNITPLMCYEILGCRALCILQDHVEAAHKWELGCLSLWLHNLFSTQWSTGPGVVVALGPRVWGEASEKGRLGKLRADRQADLRHLKLSTGLMEDDRARPCRSCRRVEACDTEGLMWHWERGRRGRGQLLQQGRQEGLPEEGLLHHIRPGIPSIFIVFLIPICSFWSHSDTLVLSTRAKKFSEFYAASEDIKTSLNIYSSIITVWDKGELNTFISAMPCSTCPHLLCVPDIRHSGYLKHLKL